ncbi:hypothetical protein ZWY2020_010176 [Hordeum vulgare]|nr:hypothetical protein ZWY2020_010176 [Hordeum vulgare]
MANRKSKRSLHIRRLPASRGLPIQVHCLTSACISSADKNLVAMYAGGHRPGPGYPFLGGYLIYDARNDSISAIPELPYDHFLAELVMFAAIVMCAAGNYDYFLAELVRVWPQCSEAALSLWRLSVKKWALHPSRLPLPSNTTSHFSSNLCFSCLGSILCWVDLLKGMVLCDLKQNCKFSFIPLPKYCPPYNLYSNKYRYGSAEEFRSMACVDGEIMFVALDEYDKHQPDLQASKGMYLTIWTLSHDLSGWKQSHKYNVENIWASEAYKPAGVRNLPPSLPVLSIHEDGVVYLVLNDLRALDHGLEYVGQWMVRVDIGNDKVQLYPLDEENSVTSQLVAIEFSAQRQHL